MENKYMSFNLVKMDMIKVTSSNGSWFYSLVKNLGMCVIVGLTATKNESQMKAQSVTNLYL